MRTLSRRVIAGIAVWLAAVSIVKAAETQMVGWNYMLLGPSTLLVDCPVCGRPSFPQPLRGTFTLTPVATNAITQSYQISHLQLRVGPADSPQYLLTGDGDYQVDLTKNAQTITLKTLITIPGAYTNRSKTFTNGVTDLTRTFPLLEFYADDAEGTFVEVFYLTLVAAPARDIWFSTASNFTQPDFKTGANGDVLSVSGRFVRRNIELLLHLGLMPGIPAYNVDALDLGAGGEILYSLSDDVFSETQGALNHGDLLSSKGTVVRRNSQLLALFGMMPPVPDLGLDAVTRRPDGEILFSIKTAAFAQGIGNTLRPGDLLSNRGQIYRTQEQLLARFHPVEKKDYGLDAVFVWPHGEIWFSTEMGFQDTALGGIQAGDLLSDQGFVVFRNLELMSAFAPIEDLADFGLDALYVVTDFAPPAPAARINSIRFDRQARTYSFAWQGDGHVFQLEKAATPLGPWMPWLEIDPATNAVFNLDGTAGPSGFLRLRQW